MSFTKLKEDFGNVAINKIGFQTFTFGFLSLMNDGNINYPLMLLTPPRKRSNFENDSISFDIVIYISELDFYRNGEQLAEEDKTDIWDSLDKMMLEFCEELPNEYRIQGGITTEPNSHSFNDSVILHKVVFTVILDKYC
jgi:hypothetical protein